MRVAVLGTGIMGSAMAKNIAKRHEVVVWDRTPAKAEQTGLEVASSPQEAVTGADVALTVLRDAAAVESVVSDVDFGDAVWMQTSTVGLGIEGLAALAEQKGATLLDAPVLGTRGPAEAGELQVLVSGPEEARRRAAPICELIGRETIDLGDQIGAASRFKLVLNSWVVAVVEGTAEVVAFAQAAGLDPEQVLETVAGGPLDCGYLRIKANAILAGDFSPQFGLRNAHKDTGLMRELAARTGIELAVTEAAQRQFGRAIELGHGDEDFIATWYATRRAS